MTYRQRQLNKQNLQALQRDRDGNAQFGNARSLRSLLGTSATGTTRLRHGQALRTTALSLLALVRLSAGLSNTS